MNNMKAVILDGHAANPGDLSWDGIERECAALTVYERTAPAETTAHIGDAEIALTNKTLITREVFDACPGLRYIGVLATGYNVVDLECARERGIAVTNIPAYSTAATAQMAIALLLEICSRVGEHDRSVHAGEWSASPDFSYFLSPLTELDGKTMGIIGFGAIGQRVGKIASALGMRVLASSPHETASTDYPFEYAPLSRLFAESDVVTLHCPLNDKTRRLIDAAALKQFKRSAILINNSRGPVIDEQAVCDALECGILSAAGFDVAQTEPIPADSPLLRAKNAVITPHISWAPAECRRRLIGIAAENIAAFRAGKRVNRVD